jgi:hypothetical protein
MKQRIQKEEEAEANFKGNYCRHTAPNGSIDHGTVDEIAFWNGEYIVQMNGKRITIEEEELDNQLEVLQHGVHSIE